MRNGVNKRWTRTTIGEAFIVNPFRPLKKGVTTPFIPMDALPANERSAERIETRAFTGSGSRFKNGDTLIARITPCLENGKTAYVSCLNDGIIAHGSTEYIVLGTRRGVTDGLFGYYLSRTPNFRKYTIGHMEGTSGRQRVPANAVENYQIELPSLNEQRSIAQILGALDDKIELNRKTNETLESMARTLFQAWFVDFEPVRAKMEGRWKRGQSLPGLPAHLYDLFPDKLIDSELGEIPLGWTVASLYEQVSLTGGGTPKRSEPSYWGGSIPWFSVKDTPGGSDVFVIDTDEHITQEGLNNSSTRILPEGTSIISARGTVGKLALVGVPMAMNQSCYGVTGKGKIGPVFNYLNLKRTVEKLKRHTHGAVFDTITQSTFETVKVSCPPDVLLAEFEELATPAFHKIKANVKESITLRKLRDTLLPRLMSGELRIPDAERIAQKAL